MVFKFCFSIKTDANIQTILIANHFLIIPSVKLSEIYFFLTILIAPALQYPKTGAMRIAVCLS